MQACTVLFFLAAVHVGRTSDALIGSHYLRLLSFSVQRFVTIFWHYSILACEFCFMHRVCMGGPRQVASKTMSNSGGVWSQYHFYRLMDLLQLQEAHYRLLPLIIFCKFGIFSIFIDIRSFSGDFGLQLVIRQILRICRRWCWR